MTPKPDVAGRPQIADQAMCSELPENNGAPVWLRLLGENLIAFRDASGRVGLIQGACPHRCTSLFLARNEENGLRSSITAGNLM